MKTINKYFLLALAGGLLSFSACSDDIEREPSPIVPEDCQGAAFSAENEYDYEKHNGLDHNHCVDVC